MSRQYPIWNKVTACIYGSKKDWGAKDNSKVEILVGSSSNNSHEIGVVETSRREFPERIVFRLYVNKQVVREMAFENNKGRAGELIKSIDWPPVTIISNN